VAVGVTAASVGSRALATHAMLAQLFIWGVGILAAVAGLCCFWLFADAVRFVGRGYRIRQLSPREHWRWTIGPKSCVYEELAADGRIRQLPFVRDILGDGYPAPGLVRITDESIWEREMPEWARGRRAEIARRIVECAGDKTHLADGS
jgi:hypothetical protein